MDFEGYDAKFWTGFGIAFVLFAVIPPWFLVFFDIGFMEKVLATVVLGAITFFAVKSGGVKRGMFVKG